MGGTASKISGGKFANGAMTGAFSQAINHEVHEKAVDRIVRQIASEGYEVVRGLAFDVVVGGDNVASIADYAYMTKEGELVLGEVKTGQQSKFTPQQKVAYFDAVEKGKIRITSAKKYAALGIQSGRSPVAIKALQVVAEPGSRVLRQASAKLLVNGGKFSGSFSVLSKTAHGAGRLLTILGGPIVFAIEAMITPSSISEFQDCPGCLGAQPSMEGN